MANKIKMHTDPILYPSINVKTFGPGEIVELEILESDNKPVFAFEKAYVRVGKANQKLSATEIRDLVKRYTLPDFDQRLLSQDFKTLDLDVAAIRNLNETVFHFGKISERRIIEKPMVLRNRGGITEGIDRLAEYIRNTPGRNVAEITTARDIPQRTIERWLKKLKEQGDIVFSGPRKSGGYFVSR